MTKEEAIKWLTNLESDIGKTQFQALWGYGQAIDEIIGLLSADTVPKGLMEQYKWERDVALAQLEEYGICFAERKRDDLVEIVRCKDCEYWKGNGTFTINGNGEEEKLCKWWSKFGTIRTAESGFCSYGERREP